MKKVPKGSAAALSTLTGKELGEILGISDRRIRELRDDGVIPDNGMGQYVLGAAVAAYCAHLRPANGKSASGGSETGATLDAARVRLVTAQAEARELLNAQLRGEAVMTEDLEAIVGATFDAVRSKMLAVPVTAAARVVGQDDKVKVQELIAGLINDALMDMASAEVVGTVKDRARRRAGRGVIGDDGSDDADS